MDKTEIEQFLAEKRVGVVGVSRNSAKFGNKIYERLKDAGYEVCPVHPEMESVGGDACVKSVSRIPEDVRALVVVASPEACLRALGEVSGTSVGRVWLYCGKVTEPKLEAEIGRLRDSGVSVIAGWCPFMFVEPVGSVHAIHRFFVRLFGNYPA